MSVEYILFSFIVINCSFEFPNNVKYLSIPVYMNENTTVYPLRGESVLIGSEYLLAKNQKCALEIQEIYKIDFDPVFPPFGDIISDIQAKRRAFPKGTISNLLYKELGNSIYGSLVRGMTFE
jgi:hypothetical protein